MSDFFTNLIARTHGTTPAVHPRLPSAFEDVPLPISFNKTTAPTEQNQIVDSRPKDPAVERSSAVAPLETPSPISAKPRDAVTKKPKSTRLMEQDPIVHPQPTHAIVVPFAALKPKSTRLREQDPIVHSQPTHAIVAPFAALNELEAPSSPPAILPSPQPQQANQPLVSDRSQPPIVAIKREAPVTDRVDRARDLSGDSRLLTHATLRAVVRSDVRRIIHAGKTPSPNHIAVPPRRRPVPLVVRQSAGSASSPPIHVTIGRVEVRAVMPPVRVPKAAPPSAAKLSLEGYLKQRNGGRP
jgi:hypothetical protein